MNNYGHKRHSTGPVPLAAALCILAALGGRAAQAQATIVTDPSQLGSAVQTDPYPDPSGDFSVIPSSFIVQAGGNPLTFTAMNGTQNGGFESFIADTTVASQFTAGDVLEETIGSDANGSVPTAPLQISFPNGVTGFGLYAQDFNPDSETFTLTVFNGATPLSLMPFNFGPIDNTGAVTNADPNGTGVAVFIGALSSGGPLITSAILSSSSSLGTGSSDDFYFGPTRVQAPVPEASTMVSFGLGLLLFAGLALGAHKRKAGGASPAASRTAN